MKKSKTSTGKTKRPQQMTKEELIATLLKKKQCNTKALSIVEGMLEGKVNPQWLLDSLQFITQSHYQDAVEERSITKICGYPLCKNPLVNVPKQQFRISTQNNKVYDISERKNFCSNACFRSSTFLKDQIMTSPLWLRDIEKVPVYKLLEGNSTKGGSGDEIDFGPTRVTAQEASIGCDKSEEPGERSEIDDDNTNQRKVDESTEYVSIEKESSENSDFLTENEHNIPITAETTPSRISRDNKLIISSHEAVPQKETEQEMKLQESSESGSNLKEPITIDNENAKTVIKEKVVPRKILCDSNSSEGVFARGVEDSSARGEGNNAERIDLRSVEEKSTVESSIRTVVETEKNAEESNIRSAVEKEKRMEESSTTSALGKERSAEESSMRNTLEKGRSGEESSMRNTLQKGWSVEENSMRNAVDKEKTLEDGKQGDSKTAVRKHRRSSRHASAKASPVAVPCVSALVEERLTEWFTVDSLCFLYGEQRTREMLGHLSGDLEQNFKPLDSATWDPEKHDRFVNICKRLNLLDLEDRSYDEKVINEDKNVVKKPLPDFNKLKEEAEKMDLRVQAFYKGQLELEPKKVSFAEDTKEEAEERESPIIPLVHQHEQRALRRRLVLDSLNRVLPDLLRTIGVNSSQVNSALRGLVGTFALTASNITFNPRHWTLVAIAIIKLLSVREARLHLALTSEASQKYLTLIQMSYNLGPTYLDLLMDRLVSSAIVPPKPPESN